jgi:hypothetical protein
MTPANLRDQPEGLILPSLKRSVTSDREGPTAVTTADPAEFGQEPPFTPFSYLSINRLTTPSLTRLARHSRSCPRGMLSKYLRTSTSTTQ